jgi:phosphoglycolate phosphatase
MKEQILIVWARVKSFLQGLSFRTGVVVLLSCVVFYLLSFGVLAMPLPVGLRGALWAMFFGLAKSAQYGGLLILGAEGVRRVKRWFGRDR